jgi:predicted metal-binding membrane protein
MSHLHAIDRRDFTQVSEGINAERANWRWEWPAYAVAALITVACWVLTIFGVRWMGPSMPMPGGWSMSSAWMPMAGQSSLSAAIMFLAMWEAMMIAMMLPSVLPMLLLFRRVMLVRRQQQRPATSSVYFAGGYFFVWLAFGVIAYLLGKGIIDLTMKSTWLARLIPFGVGATLVMAGAWQLSGWKLRCLGHCQSPFSLLAHGWHEGRSGALEMGVRHGANCAACCWALMAIQLVVGVMNLPLMLAIALVIFFEKVWRYGALLARTVGAAALIGGLVLAIAHWPL